VRVRLTFRSSKPVLFTEVFKRGDSVFADFKTEDGGVRVCGDAVLRYFWCGFAVIFILTRGIAVSKH